MSKFMGSVKAMQTKVTIMPAENSAFRALLLGLAALFLVTVQGGCAPLLLGGAAAGATVVAQERSVGDTIDDTIIRADIAGRMVDLERTAFRNVDIQVVEGRVLLTGFVPAPQNRVDAARLAWQAKGAKEVINEIEIRDKSTISDATRDSWITTQLRSRLVLDGEVRSINYTIDTVNGAVYLMGIARSQKELDRVVAHARSIEYVRRVVPHVRVKSASADGATPVESR